MSIHFSSICQVFYYKSLNWIKFKNLDEKYNKKLLLPHKKNVNMNKLNLFYSNN